MTDHDLRCPAPQYWHSPGTAMAACQCDLIAKVRADERAKASRPTFGGLLMTGLGKPEEHPVTKSMVDERYADLRAKVEALLSHHPTELVDYQWNLAINAVLDLIDGSSDG